MSRTTWRRPNANDVKIGNYALTLEYLEAGFYAAAAAANFPDPDIAAAARTLAAKPREALRIARDLVRGPREPILARIEEEARHFAERLTSAEARAAFMAFSARSASRSS